MKYLLASAATAVLLALTPAANAAPILTFGQSGGGDTITATGGLGGTTFGGTDIPVSITQIDAASVTTPVSAFLDITASNVTGVNTALLPGVVQHFSGTFSFNSLADNTGINYLSGTFSDAAISALASTGIGVFANTATFNSDVITTLDLPRSFNLALSDVGPPVGTTACTVTPTCDSGLTIASFTSAIAGTANAAVPEPASLALFGTALVGLGVIKRRRRRRNEDAAV